MNIVDLSIVILEHMCYVIDTKTIVRLSSTCKKLRKNLTSNLIWHTICKLYIAEYQNLHKADISAKKPPGFWLKWYVLHMSYKVKICKPFLAEYIPYEKGDNDEQIYEVLTPKVGSLYMETVDIDNGKQPCHIVVKTKARSKGKNNAKASQIPLKVTICKPSETLEQCLKQGYATCKVFNEVTMNMSVVGTPGLHYYLLDSSLYP